MAEEQKQEMFYVFYNRIPNSNYIFPDGVQAQFVGNRYVTSEKERADILMREIAAGNLHIFVDPNKLQVSKAELDPMAELKARIIAEYEASRAGGAQLADSSTEQGKLNVVNTATIFQAAADSDSAGSAALPGIKVSLAK